MPNSHANCTHPRTPAGRRACRAGNTVLGMTVVVNGEVRDLCATCRKNVVRKGNENCWNCAPAGSAFNLPPMSDEVKARGAELYARSLADNREIRMTGAVARRMARQAVAADNVRIQPRRSGARVSARNTSCVQAALHIDAHGGSCACGWKAKVQ